jgi:hypothetical protein
MDKLVAGSVKAMVEYGFDSVKLGERPCVTMPLPMIVVRS